MNDYDLNNFNFLRSLTEEQFDEWLAQASADDVDYALELLGAARVQLHMHAAELLDDPDLDTTQARRVIKRIQKKYGHS